MAVTMFIETETTPNPAVLKFLPGREVMGSGTRDFADESDAEASPLAAALFSLGDVSGVFFGRDFISVTAGEGVSWSALKPQVVAMLLDHFVSGAPLFAESAGNGIAVPGEDEVAQDAATHHADQGDDQATPEVVTLCHGVQRGGQSRAADAEGLPRRTDAAVQFPSAWRCIIRTGQPVTSRPLRGSTAGRSPERG